MKHIKKAGFHFLLSIGILSTVASAHADQINLRAGSGHPVGLLSYMETAHNFFVPELKKRIEAETDHNVRVMELHAGQIAKVTEVLEATRDGLLDIGFISMIFEPSELLAQNFPLFLPFGTPDAKMASEAVRATYEAHPELTETFEKKYNQKLLAVSCLSNYGLGTTFPWEDFSDLQGHKIAGAGVNLDWIKGATPVASNLNEAYQSMQTGVYQGYLSTSTWWTTFKLNEVAKHYSKIDFGAMPVNSVTVNLKTWNKLPADVQQILKEVARDYEDATAEVCAANDRNGLQKAKELGVSVKEISPEARKAWAEALKDFPNRMARKVNEQGMPGTAIMKTYISELAKRGYEFPYAYEID
ncbi:C4-dicarboxylate TRAP transporter substrate-binding protein [Stutzerimonas nitrititolerans]|uniref:C4-dicarboxylate TRAP transporter substrate-binding protein n=1 Tax=Stutzerimonas nitrititolerans TaxID=2482751 RepID=A0AA42BCM8_9GAMM|nr:C4-dicarboxylate TRAP transporter substrate-binding protein [Stutzerimonas nitrititolerans]MBT1118437.1 C4-dicarboxylate TRAP transporter substrate-binding protein [Stutzerimonas nitrititolerans]MCO7544497.1 C4-dicarboxylate TRAP transporter substrate-binding protein [Stutzerimonas nitrititolerans]WAD26446.1 C4-dicarboxylate TRAP transporter substrate-binding protein [Pseudomonadaceae bacterium T75]